MPLYFCHNYYEGVLIKAFSIKMLSYTVITPVAESIANAPAGKLSLTSEKLKSGDVVSIAMTRASSVPIGADSLIETNPSETSVVLMSGGLESSL